MKCQKGGSPTSHLWKAFNTQALKYFRNPEAFDPEAEETPKIENFKKKEAYEDERDDDDDEFEDDDEDDEGDEIEIGHLGNASEQKIPGEFQENKNKGPQLMPYQEKQQLLKDIVSNASVDDDEDDDDEEEDDEEDNG